MRYILVIFILVLAACNPYRNLRRHTLELKAGDSLVRYTVLLPRGGKRIETTDAAGNTALSFRYSNGASLFFNPLLQFSSEGLDTSMHIGRVQLGGGLFYKLQSAEGNFQRDVLRRPLWFGYRNARLGKQESRFDSAMNSVKLILVTKP